jgi:hypothetical protein
MVSKAGGRITKEIAENVTPRVRGSLVEICCAQPASYWKKKDPAYNGDLKSGDGLPK